MYRTCIRVGEAFPQLSNPALLSPSTILKPGGGSGVAREALGHIVKLTGTSQLSHKRLVPTDPTELEIGERRNGIGQ